MMRQAGLAALVAGCLLLGACASGDRAPLHSAAGPRGAPPSPPVTAAPEAVPPALTSAEGSARDTTSEVPTPTRLAARHAAAQVGAPYLYGGAGPRGFDCSGLVQYAFGMVGVSLPRDTREQRRRGRRLDDPSTLEPGDLLFFRDDRRGMMHVGLYVGEGRFVHAPSKGGTVRMDTVAASHWRRRFIEARRLAAV
jgi:murein DD-endopeptidase